MVRKIATRTTPAEREAQAAKLHETIAEQVDALRTSGRWKAFLDVTRDLHDYSLNNVLLIVSQCPQATAVRGFRAWQEHGRQVRKGEKGIRIFGYSQRKAHKDDCTCEKCKEGEADTRAPYFPVLSVFDISQTDPIDPTAPDPAVLAHRLTGADPLGVVAAVTDYLTGQDWTVEHAPITGGTNGYTTITKAGQRRVVISTDLEPAQAAKTALHEAAHIVLGHVDQPHAEYIEHRGLYETEAESVAYVVAGILGLDTSDYSVGYIAGWSQADTDVIRSTAKNALAAVRTLSAAITEPEPSAA